MDDGTETHVMKILLSDLPEALSVQKLVVAIRQGRRDQDPDLRPYRTVWGELGLIDGILSYPLHPQKSRGKIWQQTTGGTPPITSTCWWWWTS